MCNDFPIIDRLGGREAVMAILCARGVEIGSVHTIRMWSAPKRRQIPGSAVVALMKHCDENEISYSASDFEIVDNACEDAAA